MQMREKVGKSRNTVFFQWFEAPEGRGRKVGSLKRRVRSQLARWEMKKCTPLWCEAHFHGPLLEVEMSEKCTPLWREAHFEVKMYKAHHIRTTFGSCDVEKNARRCGAKQHSKWKCTKHQGFGPLLDVEMSKKCTPLWREAHFEVKMLKTPRVRTTFGRWDVVSRGRCKGLWILSKVSKTWRFCSNPKNDGRHGAFEEDVQRCIFRGRRSTKDMFMRDVRRSRVAFWSIRSVGLLRWFCVTGAALRMTWHQFFRGRRSTLERWSRNIAKRIGTRLSALHSTFDFWRKSLRIASFLMLSSLKNEEVSQNCFVFDVVEFETWRSLAELFRFWRC